MKKYLITYELKDKSRDYNDLYEAIKKIGQWWHYLNSTWIIKAEEESNPKNIYEKLSPCLASDDHIFISEIDSTDSWGALPSKEAWDWLRS